MLKSISRFSILLLIILTTFFLTCSKDSTGPKEEGTLIIASDGGVLTSPDGLLTLTIPPGALDDDTYIVIEEIMEADYPNALDDIDVIGGVYDLKPDGLALNTPAFLEIIMPKDEVTEIVDNGAYPSIGCFSLSSNGDIEEIDSSLVEYDVSNGIAKYSGQIKHFSVKYKERNIYILENNVKKSIGTVRVEFDFGPTESSIGISNNTHLYITNNTTQSLGCEVNNSYLMHPISWRIGGSAFSVSSGVVYDEDYLDWQCIEDYGENDLYFHVYIYNGKRSISLYQTCKCVSSDMADSDSDGVSDDDDQCPGGDDNVDSDSDGVPDDCDNCPNTYNDGQEDMDYDGKGDVCDNCPEVPNADQADADNDGIGDACDNNDCGDTNFETAVVFFYSIFDIIPCDNIVTLPEPQSLPIIGDCIDIIIPDYSFWPTPYANGTLTINVTVDEFGNIHLHFPGSESGFYHGPVPGYKLPSQLQGFPAGEYVFLFIVYRGDINLTTDTVMWENDLFIHTTGDFTSSYIHPSGDPNHPSTNSNYLILSKYDPSNPYGSWGNIIFDVSDGNYNQIYVDVSLLYFGNVAMYIIPRSMIGNTGYYRFYTEYSGADGNTKYYTPDWISIP